MSDFHLGHIRSALEREIVPFIDQTDLRGSADSGDHVLSRSLAAFALALTADISPELAARHVTDGYQDHGIDAFYYDHLEHRVYVVQSKWMHKADRCLKAADVRTSRTAYETS